MKLRIEMNPLVVILLALIVLLLLPDRAAAPDEMVIRSESEIEKFRRKHHANGKRFFGRKPVEEQIEDADTEVRRVVEGHIRKASGQ